MYHVQHIAHDNSIDLLLDFIFILISLLIVFFLKNIDKWFSHWNYTKLLFIYYFMFFFSLIALTQKNKVLYSSFKIKNFYKIPFASIRFWTVPTLSWTSNIFIAFIRRKKKIVLNIVV